MTVLEFMLILGSVAVLFFIIGWQVRGLVRSTCQDVMIREYKKALDKASTPRKPPHPSVRIRPPTVGEVVDKFKYGVEGRD